MSPVNIDEVIKILKEFAKDNPLEIILIGGISMQHYGLEERATIDIDGEIKGDVLALSNFLKNKNIPADIGENISSWSIISIPPGYRERAIAIYSDNNLKIKVLSPLDFVISKIRRFTEEDLEDALFTAKKFNLESKDIYSAGERAIKNSPKDTAIFVFKKNLETFIAKLGHK